MAASAGTHGVCVYAINVGAGASVLLGCSTVVVSGADPFGRVEVVGGGPGGVTASGWAIDPDTPDAIIVQMYVDGSANTMAWAGIERQDVGAAYPASGSNHGFSLSMAASAGTHGVCVYAINVSGGTSVRLGCSTVVVPSSDPFGSLETVEARDGGVEASGWAIDPDTPGAIIVQMYVDGSVNTMTWANLSRPDVGAVYPWAGADHGYSLELPVGPGAHTVCVYAINTGAGSSRLLGCRVLSGPPFFVYGSLRPGQSGYYLLDGRTTSEVNTRMPMLDLYRLSGSSYPYAVPNDGNGVGIVGDVMSIIPSLYASVLTSLDRYERYDPTLPPDNQTYVRELRPTREGLPSWVYVAGPRQAAYLKDSGILITSGDWLRW